jgi:hypothetical protein
MFHLHLFNLNFYYNLFYFLIHPFVSPKTSASLQKYSDKCFSKSLFTLLIMIDYLSNLLNSKNLSTLSDTCLSFLSIDRNLDLYN